LCNPARPPGYFGEAETDGAALAFGEVAGVVAGATDIAADGAGLIITGALFVPVAEGVAAAGDETAGPGVAVPVAAGAGEIDTPGTGVAEATGTGVCPLANSRLKLLCVLALRA
jgi:hypothetical protein